MSVEVLRKLRGDAKARQRRGGALEAAAAAPPGFDPARRAFAVSGNWRGLLERRPTIAPKAAAARAAPPPDGGAAPNVVGLDCEMVGVGPEGTRSALARVSIVDHEGNVLMDRLVRPCERVTDYRSHITGICAAMLRGPDVLPEAVARTRAAELLDGKVVVGHSVQFDFRALMLSHPHVLIRDTALFRPLRPPGRERKTPSLQGLAKHWLHESIHGAQHDSVEDARVALRLYRLKSRLWEKQLRSAMQHGGGYFGVPGVASGAAGSAGGEDEEEDQGERVDHQGDSAGGLGSRAVAREGGARKGRRRAARRQAGQSQAPLAGRGGAEAPARSTGAGAGSAHSEGPPAREPKKKRRKRRHAEARTGSERAELGPRAAVCKRRRRVPA